MTCWQCGSDDKRVMPGGAYCCGECGNPWPGETAPVSLRGPDTLVGISERSRTFAALAVVERVVAVQLDRRAGFSPCLLWLTVSQEGGAAATPFPLRVDLVAGADETGMAAADAPVYTLEDSSSTRFLTISWGDYQGQPLPMLGGTALPFLGIRVTATFAAATQVRVAWGYRALTSHPPALVGPP